jgi:nucleotide-binding universal stress UspA family protein
MKNVLLLVHDDSGQEARLQAALDVVRAVEGHLTCLDVAMLPRLIGDAYGVGGLLLDEERQREGDNRQRLEQRLSVDGLPWNWIDTTGNISSCITDAAGLADLIVVNRKLDDFSAPDMRSVATHTLLTTDKPVLAVPECTRGVNLGGHAMIAWDGSDEATAALRASVPLLKLAKRVTILEIDDGSIATSGEEAASYLSQHDVGATLMSLQAQYPDAGDDILHQIKATRPDYVVMGGFGHGRIREAVFGGVSRRMLTESPVPLLMAH